jgi:hypothetical protein
MIRVLPLVLLALLAGCDEATLARLNGEPEAVVYPPEVLAALPPGVPPSVAFLGPDGCWAVSIEVTVPQQGYAMRDANGQPVCDAAAVAAAAANAPVEQAMPTDIVPAG